MPQAADGRPVVTVWPGDGVIAHRRLLLALEAAFGVRFVPGHEHGRDGDARLVIGDGVVPPAAAASCRPRRTLAVAGSAGSGTEEVRLHADTAVDRRLHGMVLVGQPTTPELTPVAAERTLAAGQSGPAWCTGTGAGGARVDRVRGGLPVLGPSDVLRDGLRLTGSLALIALVQLLRAITPGGEAAPALRAMFVFDDPNLRRPTYGHLDYGALLAHADEHGYHAAMAMIPLDGRRPNPAVVTTFRHRPDRLSLVIHGNDHLRDELLRPPDRAEAMALGAQALRRIARFEHDTGLDVDRVMMPPHGLCSLPVLQALGALGYEAACVIHPAPWTEVTPPDQLLAGWSPAEFVAGCAVLPRFPLTAWAGEVALRAFLDQPLVLYGHHGDLSGGLEPLAEAAARVNRLGDVRWCSAREIARSAYAATLQDGVLHVRPWAARLRVRVPDEADAICVQAPPGDPAATGFGGWLLRDAGPSVPAWPSPFGTALRVPRGGELTVTLDPALHADPLTVPSPRPRLWPVARRRATETRDRLAPLWARVR